MLSIFDLPNDIDDYVHRIGRTGRAGNEGFATAFFNDKNNNVAKDLVDLMEECAQEIEPWLVDMGNRFASRGTRPRRGIGRRGGSSGGPDGRSPNGGRANFSPAPRGGNYFSNTGSSGGNYGGGW